MKRESNFILLGTWGVRILRFRIVGVVHARGYVGHTVGKGQPQLGLRVFVRFHGDNHVTSPGNGFGDQRSGIKSPHLDLKFTDRMIDAPVIPLASKDG